MEMQETGEGIILSVKVKPNSGRFDIYKKDDEAVLELTSPARENRANQEIMAELPRLLRCEVRIIRGSRSKRKLLLLKGITESELDSFLEMRCPAG